ncbi:hypothetical protein BGZ80_009595 [Entomortierella chlamydospora]|uniref:Tyrosine specific protein phosphatases domain-containing protein n=1 Tax=Entomortierella chlamydospora TaxID=101097 RepID=A0A9P6T3X6_9FUNG|nr:hypothetical protein BGZ80_009595 [Entomortierella chlamydospora]
MARFNISPIKVDSLSFLILDCPSDETLFKYIPVLEEHNTTDLVRVCEGFPYNIQPLTDIGIKVHDDMKFEDGTVPNERIVAKWLELNEEIFFDTPTPDRCIAVHCMSGIGRAPDAIAFIRATRRGALNSTQIAYLNRRRKKGFNKKSRKRNGRSKSPSGRICGKEDPSREKLTLGPSTTTLTLEEDENCSKKKGGFLGIGLESSVLFASEGAQVVCADINEKGAAATVEKITSLFGAGRAVSIRADVSKEEDVKKMIHLAVSQFGKISVLFNNAGIMHPADDNALTTPESIWDLTMNINVKGVWFGCKYAIEEMRKTGGGSIINTASFVALRGAATPQLAYTASKGAVLAMTRELAVVHAKENIRFNSLCPGPLRTPLLMEFLNTEEKKNRRLVHVPMGRFGEAIEQAKAALFLASDDSSYMTGTEFVVDGGLCSAYVTPEGETISNSPHVSYQ